MLNEESLPAGFEYGSGTGHVAASFVILGARAANVAILAPCGPPQGYSDEIGLGPLRAWISSLTWPIRNVSGTIRAGLRLTRIPRDRYATIKAQDDRGSFAFSRPAPITEFSLAPSPDHPAGFFTTVAADGESVTFADPMGAPGGISAPLQRFAAHLDRDIDWPGGIDLDIDSTNDPNVQIRGFLGVDGRP